MTYSFAFIHNCHLSIRQFCFYMENFFILRQKREIYRLFYSKVLFKIKDTRNIEHLIETEKQ